MNRILRSYGGLAVSLAVPVLRWWRSAGLPLPHRPMSPAAQATTTASSRKATTMKPWPRISPATNAASAVHVKASQATAPPDGVVQRIAGQATQTADLQTAADLQSTAGRLAPKPADAARSPVRPASRTNGRPTGPWPWRNPRLPRVG